MNAVQEQVKELVGGVCSVRRGIGDAGGKDGVSTEEVQP